ncbi:MAG: thiol:disulfide interchange protein DsbA/DsbL [Burkholderiales bacterium]|nr:thiol:disulfide interchange protein DsbA/DsbL [Burkholderiales bacterium]
MQTRRRWLSVVAVQTALVALAFIAPAAHAQRQFNEGAAWVKLAHPQAPESGSKIEVIEFFSYGCIHCYHLEEHIAAWAAKLPADVVFKRVPVFSAPYARLYYTLELLGRDELNAKVFRAIHDERINLQDEAVALAWLERQGIDRARLRDAWNAFSLNAKISRTRTLAGLYALEATPSVIVDGKYRVVYAPGRLEMNQTADVLAFLIAKARSERGK